MLKFKPKVSIIIPVYNGSKYLGRAIDSALAQTYKNIEVIVVNDGSDDKGATNRIAKSYGKRIIYFNKKENGGASTALNLGIKHMTGDYFSWLSHDDIYYPRKIERQIDELAKLEDKHTIMMSNLDGINENGEKIYETHYENHIKQYPPRKKSFLHPIVYNQTHGCTLLIPKECFETEGLFNVGERVAQDFELFYRIFKKYPHHLIPEVLVTACDTSNRMGRRAKPRASVEYSRLYINILKNLTDNEVKLLAKSKLELLYDMRAFFDAAGYVPALNYANNEIVRQIEPSCENIILNFMYGAVDSCGFVDFINQLTLQLGSIYGSADKAAGEVDIVLSRVLDRESANSVFAIRDSSVKLRDNLLQCGCKCSAAIMQKIMASFAMRSKEKRLLLKDIAVWLVDSSSCKVLTDGISASAKAVASRRKRIIFCSTHWLTGGMERVMSIIFKEIKDKYEIFLITPFDNRTSSIEIPSGVKHITISNSAFYTRFDDIVLSCAVLLQADVVVGSYNLYDKQLELYELCHRLGIKTVAFNHENYFFPYRNHGLHAVALHRLSAYNTVDAVLWPTNFSATVYGLKNNNSYWMPNPNTFDVEKNPLARGTKNIICVGRFNDYTKRIDRILECFKIVQTKIPESTLSIVGSCNTNTHMDCYGGQSVDDMILKLDIDRNKIKFTGDIKDVGTYYKAADVLLLTSNSEGFGMVINEAACFGVPTVYNFIPGLEDLVVNGENGYVVEQGNINGLAKKVIEVLSNDALASRLSNNARLMVGKFNARAIGEKWLYLLSVIADAKNDDINRKLNKKLAYKAGSYKKTSKLIFDELNLISKALIDNYSSFDQPSSKQLQRVYSSHSWRVTRLPRRMHDVINYVTKKGVKASIIYVGDSITTRLRRFSNKAS